MVVLKDPVIKPKTTLNIVINMTIKLTCQPMLVLLIQLTLLGCGEYWIKSKLTPIYASVCTVQEV